MIEPIDDEWVIRSGIEGGDTMLVNKNTGEEVSLWEVFRSPEFQEALTNEIDQEILEKLKECKKIIDTEHDASTTS